MSDFLTPTEIARVREAIEIYIRNHVVGIFQYKGDDDPNPKIGSGVAIEIGDRLFVATAAHNLRDIPAGGKSALFSASCGKTVGVIASNFQPIW
jgi:hypothetical protein